MFRQHLSWQHLSISGISQLLLIQFWWNFKVSFLGTDSNHQDNICSGNICSGDICPYQETAQLLLTRCWPNFKGLFLEPSLTDANHYGVIYPVNICPRDIFLYQEYLNCYQLNCDQTLKVYSKKNFDFLFSEPDNFTQNYCTQNLLDSTFFGPKVFWTWMFLNLN